MDPEEADAPHNVSRCLHVAGGVGTHPRCVRPFRFTAGVAGRTVVRLYSGRVLQI